MNLFSTKSTLPIPFLPASWFNFSNNFAGESFFPLTANGSPFLKLIVTKDALFGAFYEGEKIPDDLNKFDGMFCMGGPMDKL